MTVYGPNYGGTVIQGRFSVSLQEGANASNPLQRDVTVSQVGLVPLNAGFFEISVEPKIRSWGSTGGMRWGLTEPCQGVFRVLAG